MEEILLISQLEELARDPVKGLIGGVVLIGYGLFSVLAKRRKHEKPKHNDTSPPGDERDN